MFKISFLADKVEKAANFYKDCSNYDIYQISRISKIFFIIIISGDLGVENGVSRNLGRGLRAATK